MNLSPDADAGVPELVAEALRGDQSSWNRLVDRYTPLVLSIVRRHRLQGGDAEDVVQTVWLRLVEHLGEIRDPQALPGWIATTGRHECLRVLRGHHLVSPTDLQERGQPEGDGAADLAGNLLEAQRHEALLIALAELPERQRALLLLLIEDPPLSYEEISRRLAMPVGSIGPTRARALTRIRAHGAVQALTVV
ncbi:sigma-70 family RNA polymerase sigma factor [Geodermatophilus sp. YIM 151500]|uniref:RNA polymerase sigma factor n=1 Tax=Geodermatophilus sp. YIM 151500 TaxID=2984531 RepID=UPI0021E45B02|nr:sigma-70 family RNA polymerase sigma factor [Geodermatophilus sp. YIM 151500]MCV2489843.1 sigma-70 family RNA polymerase sigma factor [Geodermatophilus sp. YIM 151500]